MTPSEYNARYRIKHPTQSRITQRNNWLKRAYGITLEEYAELLTSQNGRCAVCRTDDPRASGPNDNFSVDHDHITGKIRGLLCNRCNRCAGMMEEDVFLIQSLADYVRKAYADIIA